MIKPTPNPEFGYPQPTQKKWLRIIPVIALGLVAVLAMAGSDKTIGQDTNMNETTSLPKELAIEHVVRVLGEFQERPDILRKYILIPTELSDEQVIAVLSELHQVEPDTWYYLMDSDSHFDKMLSALPETRNRDYSNWPEEYVEQHFVARLVQEIHSDGKGKTWRRWLVSGAMVRENLEVYLD